MNSLLLELVTDASLRSTEQLHEFAIEQTAAGTPWLGDS